MIRRHPVTILAVIVLAVAALLTSARWNGLAGGLVGLGLFVAAALLLSSADRPAPRRPAPKAKDGPAFHIVDPPPYDWAKRGRW